MHSNRNRPTRNADAVAKQHPSSTRSSTFRSPCADHAKLACAWSARACNLRAVAVANCRFDR
eukprot:10265719-Lingulodinium_polyedra.AAC.1